MRGLFSATLMLALVLFACSGSDDSGPAALVSATPARTPVPEATPAFEPTAAPRPTPATPVGPLLVALSGNPQLDLLVYDIGDGSALFEMHLPVGNVASYTGDARAGKILVTNDTTVSEVPLDGSPLRELFRVPSPDYRVGDVAVSPDGRTAAIAVMHWPASGARPTPDDGDFVLFFDLLAGQEFSRVTKRDAHLQDGEFAGFVGRFYWLSWRDDGQGVVVSGATFSERPGSWATVFLDGRVVRHDLVAYGTLAPNGRLAAHGAMPQFACLAVGSLQLDIRDLDAGADVASVRAREGFVLTAWDWSPDSTQLLVAEAPLIPNPGEQGGVCLDPNARQMLLFDLASRATRPVDDLAAMYEGWYSPARLSMQCADGTEAFTTYTRWTERYVTCNDPPGSDNPLFLDGKQIAEGNRFQVIGILDIEP